MILEAAFTVSCQICSVTFTILRFYSIKILLMAHCGRAAHSPTMTNVGTRPPLAPAPSLDSGTRSSANACMYARPRRANAGGGFCRCVRRSLAPARVCGASRRPLARRSSMHACGHAPISGGKLHRLRLHATVGQLNATVSGGRGASPSDETRSD